MAFLKFHHDDAVIKEDFQIFDKVKLWEMQQQRNIFQMLLLVKIFDVKSVGNCQSFILREGKYFIYLVIYILSLLL